jgi:hypothetical protein
VAHAVTRILEEEGEAASNLLDALAIKDFEELQTARRKRDETRNGCDNDVIMKDLEMLAPEQAKEKTATAVEQIQMKAAIPCPSAPVGLGISEASNPSD